MIDREPGLMTLTRQLLAGDISPLEYGQRKKKRKAPECKESNYLCKGKSTGACISKSKSCKSDLPVGRKPKLKAIAQELAEKGGKPFTGYIGGKKNGVKLDNLTPEHLEIAAKFGVSQRQLMASRVPEAVQSDLLRSLKRAGVGVEQATPYKKRQKARTPYPDKKLPVDAPIEQQIERTKLWQKIYKERLDAGEISKAQYDIATDSYNKQLREQEARLESEKVLREIDKPKSQTGPWVKGNEAWFELGRKAKEAEAEMDRLEAEAERLGTKDAVARARAASDAWSKLYDQQRKMPIDKASLVAYRSAQKLEKDEARGFRDRSMRETRYALDLLAEKIPPQLAKNPNTVAIKRMQDDYAGMYQALNHFEPGAVDGLPPDFSGKPAVDKEKPSTQPKAFKKGESYFTNDRYQSMSKEEKEKAYRENMDEFMRSSKKSLEQNSSVTPESHKKLVSQAISETSLKERLSPSDAKELEQFVSQELMKIRAGIGVMESPVNPLRASDWKSDPLDEVEELRAQAQSRFSRKSLGGNILGDLRKFVFDAAKKTGSLEGSRTPEVEKWERDIKELIKKRSGVTGSMTVEGKFIPRGTIFGDKDLFLFPASNLNEGREGFGVALGSTGKKIFETTPDGAREFARRALASGVEISEENLPALSQILKEMTNDIPYLPIYDSLKAP